MREPTIVTTLGFWGSVRKRAGQLLAAFTVTDRATDEALRVAVANERQWELLLRLSDYDRRHTYEVYKSLVNAGYQHPDLLCAALLHDVGKADERGRVRLVHRVVWVLAARLFPDLAQRLANGRAGWLRYGLYLASEHPRLGSALVREQGASQRCCELIARHHDRFPTGDQQLDLLIAADEGHLQ